jgi:hypothetical protein
MAEERLFGVDESLLTLIVTVMYESPPMTSAQIALAATNRSARRVDRRQVETLLGSLGGAFVSVAGVPRRQVIRHRRHGLIRRMTRWSLVDAPASGSPPDTSGAPAPLRPYPSTSSGAAAAPLTFRADEPPTNAIGRQP